MNDASADDKTMIKDIISPDKLGKEYYDALNNAMKFMDFTLTEV